MKELSKSIEAQNMVIRTLTNEVGKWAKVWEAPSGEEGWEVPEVGKKGR